MTDHEQPVPGWYPDTNMEGVLRWWDGQAWTDSTQSLAPPVAADPVVPDPIEQADPLPAQSRMEEGRNLPEESKTGLRHRVELIREKRKSTRVAEVHAKQLNIWRYEQDVLDQRAHRLTSAARGEVQPATGIALSGDDCPLWAGVAHLVEPRRQPGHYTGGSSGVSVPVGFGIRTRVGSSHGSYTPGADIQSPVDLGRAAITDQRIVFVGSRSTREWAFSKLLAVNYVANGAAVLLPVSGRGTVSGLQAEAWYDLRLYISIALFAHQHGLQVASELSHREAEIHRASRP